VTQLAASSAAPWSRVVFTTYALSLTFFETVVMDALIRARARDITILSDIEGVRCSLGEKGVRGAGRDYQLEPVAVDGGVFHPKIGAFIGDDDVLLTLGSGNLTFGGWANNLEMVDFLHPSFASSAFRDAADLFEDLADHPRVRHRAAETCAGLAQDLVRSTAGRTDRGDLRVLHGMSRGIGGQLVDWADDLGGATRLAVVSPYFDDGSAIEDLGRRLKIDEVHVHHHLHKAAGSAPSWPWRGAIPIRPIALDFMEEDTRPLHAKAFEIVCRKGRLLVSGSANASTLALAEGGNVEAVVMRRFQARSATWGWTLAEAPSRPPASAETAADEEVVVGVLRAQLDGATLTGWVVMPPMPGPAEVEQLTSLGPEPLGSVIIDDEGGFRLEAPDLEVRAWNAGRLVLRVKGETSTAEGYAASSAAGAVARRVGVLAPRLFALLGGSDTPDDIIALFDWIFQEPDHLPGMMHPVASDQATASGEDDRVIAVADLTWTPARPTRRQGDVDDAAVMVRLIEQLRRTLRGKKGAYEAPAVAESGDDTDKDELAQAERERRRHEDTLARSEDLTADFLQWALKPEQAPVWAVLALELLNHMAQRLDWAPGPVQFWLERVASALRPNGISESDRPLVAGSLLALVGRLKPSLVRAHFYRLRLPLTGAVPDIDQAPLLARAGAKDAEAAWSEVRATRSVEEVVAEFVHGLKNPDALDLPLLAASPLQTWCPEEWPTLREALTSSRRRGDVRFGKRDQKTCPKCSSLLPSSQWQNYRTRLVATAKNCGHGVIIFGGDEA